MEKIHPWIHLDSAGFAGEGRGHKGHGGRADIFPGGRRRRSFGVRGGGSGPSGPGADVGHGAEAVQEVGNAIGEDAGLKGGLAQGAGVVLRGLGLGGGLLGGPALAVKPEALFGDIAPAQAGELAGEGEEGLGRGGIGRGGAIKPVEAAAQRGGEDGGEEGGGRSTARGLGEGGGLLRKVAQPEAELLEAEPVGMAALAPGAQVLGGEGGAAKMGGKDGLDGGEAVEPLEEGAGGLAVVETGVELLAEFVGEAGDFTVAGHGDRSLTGKRRGIKM